MLKLPGQSWGFVLGSSLQAQSPVHPCPACPGPGLAVPLRFSACVRLGVYKQKAFVIVLPGLQKNIVPLPTRNVKVK